MPPTANQLQDMDLTESGTNSNDEGLVWSDWDRKLILQNAIKASDQANKPKGDSLWATQKGSVPNSTACNMMVNIARFKAVVTGGGVNGADKDLHLQRRNSCLDKKTHHFF